MVFFRTRRGVDGNSFTANQRVAISGSDIALENYATVKRWDDRRGMYEVEVDRDDGRSLYFKPTDMCSVLSAWERFANAGSQYLVPFKTLQKDWKSVGTAQGVANLLADYRRRHSARTSSLFKSFLSLPAGWASTKAAGRTTTDDVTIYTNEGLVICPAVGRLPSAVALMGSDVVVKPTGSAWRWCNGLDNDIPPGFDRVAVGALPVRVHANVRALLHGTTYMWNSELHGGRLLGQQPTRQQPTDASTAASTRPPTDGELGDELGTPRVVTTVLPSSLHGDCDVGNGDVGYGDVADSDFLTKRTLRCPSVMAIVQSLNYMRHVRLADTLAEDCLRCTALLRRLKTRKKASTFRDAVAKAKQEIDTWLTELAEVRRYLDDAVEVRLLTETEQLQWIRAGGDFQSDNKIEERVKCFLVRTMHLHVKLDTGTVNGWAEVPEPGRRKSTKFMVKVRGEVRRLTSRPRATATDAAGLRIVNSHLTWNEAVANLDEITRGNPDTPAGLYPWLPAVATCVLSESGITLQRAMCVVGEVHDRLRRLRDLPDLAPAVIDRVICRHLPVLRVSVGGATLYVNVHDDQAVCLAITETAKMKPHQLQADEATAETKAATVTGQHGPDRAAAKAILDLLLLLVPAEATFLRGWRLMNTPGAVPHQSRRSTTAASASATGGEPGPATATATGGSDGTVSEECRNFMSILNAKRTGYWSSGFTSATGHKSGSQYWARPFPLAVPDNAGSTAAHDAGDAATPVQRRPTVNVPAATTVPHLCRPYADTTFADLLSAVDLAYVLLPDGLPRHVPHAGTCMPVFATESDDKSSPLTIDLTVTSAGAASAATGRHRPGPKPLHEQYPNMIAAAKEFISSNGTRAQERRRNETVNMRNGVTRRQLRDHILSRVPELDKLSVSTVARMLVAPNKRNRNARRYHGVVNARVPKKSNSRRGGKKGNINHLCMALMAYMLENGVDMQDCIDVWSVDDKAKLKVSSGCPCVSRYHQIRRFFMADDAPNFHDHDFPTQGYLLCPSGYKELIQEPWQRSTRYYDRHGRPHLPVCREGPLTIVLRACKYAQSNAMSHANDMYRMYKSKDRASRKPVLLCYADGGPDWSIASQKSLYYYGRFWMKSGLDAFGMGSGGGGYSAFNPIERSWAPVSKQLSGVYLSDTLPNEDEAPIKQSGLTARELIEKEHVVFDSAMQHAARLWNNGFTIAGHKVHAEVVQCADKPTPFDDMANFELWTRIASTHKGRRNKIRQRLTKLGVPATKERVDAMMDITNRMRFFTKHVDRRSEFMLFRKGPPSCCEWCRGHPRQPGSAPFFKLIQQHGNYFTPQKDPGVTKTLAYKTYMQVRHCRRCLKFVPNALMDAELGPRDFPYRCENEGCTWFFNSKADWARHKGRGWCKKLDGRSRKRRRSRAKGAVDGQLAQRRRQGQRFSCPHEDCVVGKLNQSLTKQKRAAHWKEHPSHRPKKKAKKPKPRHLTPGRSQTRPATAAGTEATDTADSTEAADNTNSAEATGTAEPTDGITSDEDDFDFEVETDEEEEEQEEQEMQEVESFVDRAHDKVAELLVEDGVDVWRHATIFRHKESKGHVLWFNGTLEYEGLGGKYTFKDGVLADPDGDEVHCKRLRWWRHSDRRDTDYCGKCYEKERYGSTDGAARALRAASRSGDDAVAPANAPTPWVEVTEDNAALMCDEVSYFDKERSFYEAECDKCGAHLHVAPKKVRLGSWFVSSGTWVCTTWARRHVVKGKAPFEGGVCDLDVSLCATAVLSRLSRVGISPLVVWHAMTPPLSHSRPSQFECRTASISSKQGPCGRTRAITSDHTQQWVPAIRQASPTIT